MSKLTINEIAERAGVSKTTVSFFLNGKTHKMSEDTQQRIQRIIDETGYEPSAAARAMKSKSTGLIGVILGDISDPYCAKALKGMEDAASARDFQILPGSSEMLFKSEQEYVERMMRMGVEDLLFRRHIVSACWHRIWKRSVNPSCIWDQDLTNIREDT